jgi:hypothetical protein
MAQFSRQMGATVGVAVFGTFLTQGLTAELPRHVPHLPGAAPVRIDLAHAQSQAMHVDEIRERVTSAMDDRYAVIERAYQEDPDAVDEIVGDPRIPQRLKEPLRDGGIRGRIHRELTERAQTIQKELQAGETGRERLLHDPALPAGLRQQIENIPVRVLRDPELIAGVSRLFGDAILAKENSLVAATAQQSLLMVRAGMSAYATELVAQIQRGMKVAFATSIVHMLERAQWIVGLAVLIVLFIPEVPLRSRSSAAQTEDNP